MLSYTPDGVTEALEAATRLLHRPEWRDSEHAPHLRAQLAAQLNSRRRHLRHLAVNSLPVWSAPHFPDC